MSFNLSQSAQLVLTQRAHRIAERFNLSTSEVKQVLDISVPILVALCIKKAETPEGAHDLYTSVCSSRVDSYIAINLSAVFHAPLAVSNLVKLGIEQIASLVGEKEQDFIQVVVFRTKIASTIIACILSISMATIFGLMKGYLLSHTGRKHVLLAMLLEQIVHIKDAFHEGLWVSLDLGNVEAFFKSVEVELKSALTASSIEKLTSHEHVTSVKKLNRLGQLWTFLFVIALIILFFIATTQYQRLSLQSM